MLFGCPGDVDLGDKTDTGKGRFSSQITCYSQAHSFLHLPRGDEGGIHILKCACSVTARARRILILRRACQMSSFPSFKGESTVAYPARRQRLKVVGLYPSFGPAIVINLA